MPYVCPLCVGTGMWAAPQSGDQTAVNCPQTCPACLGARIVWPPAQMIPWSPYGPTWPPAQPWQPYGPICGGLDINGQPIGNSGRGL